RHMLHSFVVRRSLLALFIAWMTIQSCLAAPPKVDSLFPAGSKAGTKTIITATGAFPDWTIVATDRGDVTVKAEADKGKFAVQITENSPTGIAWLRFWNDEGASALRPFMVGSLNEFDEVEPNDTV